MLKKALIIVSIFLMLFIIPPVYSQVPDKNFNVSLALGPGFFVGKNSQGISFYSSVFVSKNKLIETNKGLKRKNNTLEFRFINHFDLVKEDNYGRLYDFGLLYGKSFGKVIRVTISGGAGMLGGKKTVTIFNGATGQPEHKDEGFLTPNFPVELGVSLVPIEYIGLGISGFASINSENSVFGCNLKLQFGRIR